MAALPNTWATGNSYTAAAQNAVADAVNGLNLSGVYASLPSASFPGRLYFCTDNGNRYRDNGTSWDLIAVGGDIGGTEPPSTGWTTTTLSTSTITSDRGGRLLTVVGSSGDNWRGEYRTLSPTSNYTITGHFQTAAYGQGNFSAAGLKVRQSSNSNFVTFGPGYNTANGNMFLGALVWTSTTVSSFLGGLPFPSLPEGMPKWLRIRDNATNRFYEYSYNGIDWTTVYQQGRTTSVTPDQYGWGGSVNNASFTNVYRLRSLTLA